MFTVKQFALPFHLMKDHPLNRLVHGCQQRSVAIVSCQFRFDITSVNGV